MIEMVIQIGNLFKSKASILVFVKKNLANCIRSDESVEYIGSVFQNLLKKEGIVHDVSTWYLPVSDWGAERRDKSFSDLAWALIVSLSDSKQNLGAETVIFARLIGNVLHMQRWKVDAAPHDELYVRRPDVSRLKLVGAKA